MERSVWIGFDPREADGYAVTRASLERHLNTPVVVRGLVLDQLQRAGLYTREMRWRNGRMFDVVSNHDMATEFAISRFFVPYLVRSEMKTTHQHWAIFMDSDMLVLEDINRLFERADPRYAVMVVKHNHQVTAGQKMDGQTQTPYFRKNWSSVMMFNVNHPVFDGLDLNVLNSTKGLALHQLTWCPDDLIGEIDIRWNFLEGYNDELKTGKPHIVHFTEGLPSMSPDYNNTRYAGLWWEELQLWAQ